MYFANSKTNYNNLRKALNELPMVPLGAISLAIISVHRRGCFLVTGKEGNVLFNDALNTFLVTLHREFLSCRRCSFISFFPR